MAYHLSVVEIIHEINQQDTPPSPKPRTPEMSITLQLSEKNIGAVREVFKKNAVAGDIFLFLTEFMNKKNAVVCSHKVLEEVTGKKRTTVSLVVKYLKDNEFITVLKIRTSNVYVLNPHVVWRAWRTNKPYCQFDGPITIKK